ncbi:MULTISPECIES: competence/damage-inducible protein A [Priestia]|jgi:nicotinamide-nucleotide amidase|uniref:Putative competence-damage inducible protein n=2 Tax=Priestia TaxID=2800373 RepID=A0A2B9R3H9_PRIMG|nr:MULTISPECIES: competence/damage-inducible protein A [Priestia]AVX10013.1 competence/damage-inducible protein A [Bacillus sp. Y-01]MDH6652865.1 nicotinamide-nucleotide amidase [Bacillus sp. PvP124]RFB25768.1 competence/damage-inducible protein A [Bacillus sp. ALD]RFB36954.1 competence/damage-inducible protein A [Bacillus sp. RC]ANF47765.1 competence/damage-inducible protein A [Priestia megaterium]
MMNAEIIGVGSELLLGQIANTNAQYLSKKLAELGINVYYHTVVGDNAQRLKEVIATAQTRAELIIFTGGLGPTKDDLTKETIASVLGVELTTNAEALESIEAYFKQSNRVMTPNNKKQAIVLEGSAVLPNDYGMAPGMGLTVEGKHYMLFPGPPKELYPMYESYGQEFLAQKLELKESIESRVLRFFGIGESQLETEIEDLLDAQTNPTIAPLAGDGEVTLRLTAKHANAAEAQRMLDEVEKTISERVGEYLYGYEATSLHNELVKELTAQGLTIASAESLTGGLFSERLTTVSGSGEAVKGSLVAYHYEIKQNILGVSEHTLNQYGAVSEQCAAEMAQRIQQLYKTDIGIGFTGVAGPSKQEGHPVGTVYIGVAYKDQAPQVYSLQLSGSRQGIRSRTVNYGCHYVLKMIKK